MSSNEPTNETGWVIEHAVSPTHAPTYWTGDISAWSSNHLDAVRFSRAIDAEKVAENVMPYEKVRIAEHQWG